MRQFFLYTLLIIIFPVLGWAHEIRPAYLEIKENTDHSLEITWKQPLMGEYGVPLHPSISAGWLKDELAKASSTESYLIKRWQIPAGHEPLDGQTIQIRGLERTITDVMVQVTLLDDASFTYLIKPIRPSVQLNLSKPVPPPVLEYVQLGIFHIWSGFDHLLFVFGLLLFVEKEIKIGLDHHRLYGRAQYYARISHARHPQSIVGIYGGGHCIEYRFSRSRASAALPRQRRIYLSLPMDSLLCVRPPARSWFCQRAAGCGITTE